MNDRVADLSTTFANDIVARIQRDLIPLQSRWQTASPIPHVFIDDLLPAETATHHSQVMPQRSALVRKRSLRESKSVGVNLERYDPAVGAILYAFQDPRVVKAVESVTGIPQMDPDPSLYASGISLMEYGDFLNPHLDNSHDGDQTRYRVLNLLYYLSPSWTLQDGGNLELWTQSLENPTVVESRFNRLVLMATNDRSWHSVQAVRADAARYCVSNYYFSARSPVPYEYRNVTSFRGRPEQPVIRVLLRLDSLFLNLIGRLFPILLRRNLHRRRG